MSKGVEKSMVKEVRGVASDCFDRIGKPEAFRKGCGKAAGLICKIDRGGSAGYR